jgi:hypothetical protein
LGGNGGNEILDNAEPDPLLAIHLALSRPGLLAPEQAQPAGQVGADASTEAIEPGTIGTTSPATLAAFDVQIDEGDRVTVDQPMDPQITWAAFAALPRPGASGDSSSQWSIRSLCGSAV